EIRALRTIRGDRQRGLRDLILDQPEGPYDVGDVIERLEQTAAHEPRREHRTFPIREALQLDDVVDRPGLQTEFREHCNEIPGRHDYGIHAFHERHRGSRPAPQVVLGLTTAVVQDDLLAIQLGREQRRHYREKVRPVRSGKHLNDVIARQTREQQQQVIERRDGGPYVPDPLQPPQRSRQTWIVRNEPDLEFRLRTESPHQADALDRLPGIELQRRRRYADADLPRSGHG